MRVFGIIRIITSVLTRLDPPAFAGACFAIRGLRMTGGMLGMTAFFLFPTSAWAVRIGDILHVDGMSHFWRFLQFQDAAVQDALLGAVLLGISCGVLGSFILVRKMALMGDALSHAVLPGVAAGFLWVLKKDPVAVFVGAIATGILGTFVVSWITQTTKIKSDSAIGMVLAAFFAIGIAMVAHIQHLPTGNKSGLDHFLFGQIAAMGPYDIALMAGVTIMVIGGVMVCYRGFLILSFDSAYASTVGLPIKFLHYLMMMLLSFAVVTGLQAVGVVLVSAMLIIPAACAYLLTDQLKTMVMLAAGIGIFSAVLGALLSFLGSHFPTGPLMVLASSVVFGGVFCFAPKHGVISRWMRHASWRHHVAKENALKGMYQVLEAAHFQVEGVNVEDLALRRHLASDQVRRDTHALARDGLVIWGDDRMTMFFTPEGWRRACSVVRRHRLWELYLTQECHVAQEVVHESAEEIEHVLGEDTVRTLEKRLKFPNRDPHGRLIPSIEDMLQNIHPSVVER